MKRRTKLRGHEGEDTASPAGQLPSGTTADPAPSGGATDECGRGSRKDSRVRQKVEEETEKGSKKVKKDHEEKDEAERKERQADVPKGKEAERDAASPAGQLPSGTTADLAPSGGVTEDCGRGSRKDSRVRKEKDEEETEKGGKRVKSRQETRGKGRGARTRSRRRKGKEASRGQEGDAPKDQGMGDVSSPGAASSNQVPTLGAQPGTTSGAGNRTLAEPWNEDEAPDKA